MLRLRSAVGRSGPSLHAVQGGRWGAVLKQGGGHFQPAASPSAGASPPSVSLEPPALDVRTAAPRRVDRHVAAQVTYSSEGILLKNKDPVSEDLMVLLQVENGLYPV